MIMQSNYTLEETIKYCLPTEYQDSLSPLVDKTLEEINQKDNEIERLRKNQELIEEQVGFARMLIEEIKEKCGENGNKRELVKNILNAIEDSLFEGE